MLMYKSKNKRSHQRSFCEDGNDISTLFNAILSLDDFR